MRSDQGPANGTGMSYFVLPSADGADELARMNRRGLAAYYDPATGTWINDALLASEIRLDQTWRPAEAHELPDGIALPADRADVTGSRDRHTWKRRERGGPHGRHSQPKEA